MKNIIIAGVIFLLTLNVLTGCQDDQEKVEFKHDSKEVTAVDMSGIEKQAIEEALQFKKEHLKAQFEAEWKAEQERIAKEKGEAKAEAEQKAKEEEAKKLAQNPANMGPVAKAQWENNNFADVHERANYLVANPNHLANITSDADTKAYLVALNDSLQSSGELQTEFMLTEGFPEPAPDEE